MIDQLKAIITASNPLYTVEYEESRTMNLNVDEMPIGTKFAYIEEFNQGKDVKGKYVKQVLTRVEIYFCEVIDENLTAVYRESIRDRIKEEVMRPFENNYNNSGFFERIEEWTWDTYPRGFDANTLHVRLQFDCKQNIC